MLRWTVLFIVLAGCAGPTVLLDKAPLAPPLAVTEHSIDSTDSFEWILDVPRPGRLHVSVISNLSVDYGRGDGYVEVRLLLFADDVLLKGVQDGTVARGPGSYDRSRIAGETDVEAGKVEIRLERTVTVENAQAGSPFRVTNDLMSIRATVD